MNSSSKDRIKQQMRLFDKISSLLQGKISDETLSYFLVLHLISGIRQSQPAGLSAKEFAAAMDFAKYQSYYHLPEKQKKVFFRNENATFFGKCRIALFFYLMRIGKYQLAGKTMGLA